MLGRIGRDAGSLLGVEIASNEVRLIQLQRRRGRQKVIAWAIEPLATALCGDGSADAEPILLALRQAHRRCGARQRQVAVALSGSQVICKLCQLPADLPEDEREARLLIDAQRLFPFPLNDLALDFQVLGASATVPDALDVLVGAYRQSLIEPILQRFEEAGLEIVAVEIDSLALRRVMSEGNERGLLQVEGELLTLHGWSSGPLAWRRELRVEATSNEDDLVRCVERLIGPELRPLLGGGLLITGQGASEALATVLEARLGVTCTQLRPLDGFDLGGNADTTALSAASGCMALSLGLALGGCR